MDYKTALEFCGGSQSEMARRLGVSQGAVSRWSRMPRIPPGQQFRIAALTGGALTVDPECLPNIPPPPALPLPADTPAQSTD
jgi:DNA-binding transcriptional regulator YdaS (Cro superfamily)